MAIAHEPQSPDAPPAESLTLLLHPDKISAAATTTVTTAERRRNNGFINPPLKSVSFAIA
jgi:hypothetical protein